MEPHGKVRRLQGCSGRACQQHDTGMEAWLSWPRMATAVVATTTTKVVARSRTPRGGPASSNRIYDWQISMVVAVCTGVWLPQALWHEGHKVVQHR